MADNYKGQSINGQVLYPSGPVDPKTLSDKPVHATIAAPTFKVNDRGNMVAAFPVIGQDGSTLIIDPSAPNPVKSTGMIVGGYEQVEAQAIGTVNRVCEGLNNPNLQANVAVDSELAGLSNATIEKKLSVFCKDARNNKNLLAPH